MKSIVLAAGYATRLYPLTENFPKPLLEIAGKSILDRLLEDIDLLPEINEHIIISNARYYDHFVEWKKNSRLKNPITIINDGSTANDNRLGAVCDIQFAIEECKIDDDIIVVAGDNVLDFSFRKFVDLFNEKKSAVIMCSYVEDINRLKRSGVIIPDGDFRVISMEEKPSDPKSNWCTAPFYIYKKEELALIKKAIDSGCKTDAPGSLVCWLCERTDVFALRIEGKRYDIGTLESYENVKKIFKEK